MKLKIQPITYTNLMEIIEFLKQEEKTCITLMSRFVEKDNIDLLPSHIKGYSFYWGNSVIGVLAVSDGGIVLHHFDKSLLETPFKELKNLQNMIYQSLKLHNIYSIIGDMKGTEFLEKILEADRVPKIKIPYTLMSFETKNIDLHISEEYQLKKCSKEDAEALYPLQAAYDMVEVLPPGEDFNPDTCRLNLRYNLSKQYIIGLINTAKKRFVSKAGTNAIGLNWVQIGGVFTKEEYRGLGLASFMVNSLAKIMILKGKKVALFVKDSNESAKKAYIRAGFEANSKFCICYY